MPQVTCHRCPHQAGAALVYVQRRMLGMWPMMRGCAFKAEEEEEEKEEEEEQEEVRGEKES